MYPFVCSNSKLLIKRKTTDINVCVIQIITTTPILFSAGLV